MSFDPNAPVLVAVAQQTWRDPDASRTPLDALHDVASQALDRCHNEGLRGLIDAVATVRFITDTNPDLIPLFPRNPGQALAARLGIEAAQYLQTTIGGNTPQLLVNHFARQLAQGEVRAVLITGAELLNTFFNALRNGDDISAWAGEASPAPGQLGEERDGLNSSEMAHGLYEPINTYPLFENALRYRSGRSWAEEEALTAELCAGMAAVAANNPHAWSREALSAQTIAAVSPQNRYIGYPYPKAMNAVLAVDMAAAVIMTTAGTARTLGIDPSQLVYLRSGMDINDIWYPTERAALHESPAIEAAASAVLEQGGLSLEELNCFDIYSCFPSAVRVACNAIGLSPLDERGVTVTGGLPFFGGPGNNYALHAIAQMADELRNRGGGSGLVTANGLYLTKHSLGLYSTEPGEGNWGALDSRSLQQQIDNGPQLPLARDTEGKARVETFTVTFDKQGPAKGIVIASNEAGERIIANTADDPEVLEQWLASRPFGEIGKVTVADGLNRFEL